MRKFYYTFLLLFFLGGCGLIDYHPYDGRITGDKDINATNISRIEAICKDKSTIRFIMMGDTQRWYDETELFVKDVNKRGDIDFVIHGGDVSDFGMTVEFEWVHNIMKKLNVPYVALLGNHDIIGNGIEVFNKMYGKENFSFVAGSTKFVCLNTNALEFDYSHPVPDFSFMKSEIIDSKRYDKSVVVMHVPPYDQQFDNNVLDPFQYYIKQFNNLQFCLYAHVHRLKADDMFGDGVWYYGTHCMKGRCYYLFTLTPEGYDYEVVYF